MGPRSNGTTPRSVAGSPDCRFLAAAERDRFMALAKSAAAAERGAATAEAQRKASWRECQRLSFEAGLARGRHFSLANAARRAAAEAFDIRRALRRAAVEAYVTWTRRHRDSPESDHERFVTELAEACGMPPRDFLRLVGRGASNRTIAEREEDFARYRAGWSMRAIAKARGIAMSAVQKDVHARLARLVAGQTPALDGSNSNQTVAEHSRVADESVAVGPEASLLSSAGNGRGR